MCMACSLADAYSTEQLEHIVKSSRGRCQMDVWSGKLARNHSMFVPALPRMSCCQGPQSHPKGMHPPQQHLN